MEIRANAQSAKERRSAGRCGKFAQLRDRNRFRAWLGNRLGGRTSLDEKGGFISANMHDILTGSNADGTLAAGDTTCEHRRPRDGWAQQ